MSNISGTQTVNSLQEAIADLSSRGSSGRLQIRAGDTRGALFFRNGKLVDARLGPFTGYVAINLAVSISDYRLSFDPSIELPPATIKDLNERTLLKERFGIDTLDPVDVPEPIITEAATAPDIVQPTLEEQRLEATLPSSQARPPERHETEARNDSPQSGRGLFSSFDHTQKPYNPRRRLILRAGFAVVIIITAVATASYWATGKQTPALSRPTPVSVQPLPTSTPLHEAAAKTVVTQVETTSQLPVRRSEAPVSTEDTKSKPVGVVDPKGTEVGHASSVNAATDPNAADKPSSQTVVVVVQVAEGHVTEAYIQNPRSDLRAYEATALRMARERRYPKDKNGKETVVLKVTDRRRF